MREQLLLDTNIVILMVNEMAGSLQQRLRNAIDDALLGQTVSVVSVWEMAIKTAAGKLYLKIGVDEVERFLEDIGIAILPITLQHVVAVAQPEPATRDPFDRLLLGICAVEGMRLVTTDGALREHALAY